jgi:hypothetical protein
MDETAQYDLKGERFWVAHRRTLLRREVLSLDSSDGSSMISIIGEVSGMKLKFIS